MNDHSPNSDEMMEALRVSNARFLGLVGSIPDWIWEVDAQNRITYSSPSIRNILGYAPEEVIGLTPLDLMPPDEAHRVSEVFTSMTRKQKSFAGFENVNRHRDGHLVVLESSGNPIWGHNGEFLGYRGIDRDITDRKRMEEDLFKMHKLQSIGMLAGGIAHDFNNILMGLFGYISLAQEELPQDHPSLAYLEEAGKCWERAVHLTNQLLTFAKGGAPIKEEVDLGELVEEVAQFDLSGSNVKLVFQQVENLRMAEVDKGQIQQVISNLTINACEAMPHGGHLYIALENSIIPDKETLNLPPGFYVKLTMRDEGCGIAAEHLDRIFDPYFTTKAHGGGFGLATTYSIINKHGGHISVVSAPGKGTTFTLLLPASRFPSSPAVKRPVESGLALQRAFRVLVMDDEPAICDVLSKMLTANGLAVETVPGGKEAKEAFIKALEAGSPFDVVVMDLTIPGGIGGKEAVKELLSIDPNIRCIVSSGYADDPVMANYAEYGFHGVAVKPYSKNKLLAVLAQVLK